MAVHSSFALGLHRWKDTMVMFDTQRLTLRRNIWRSLFVLDRLISASMGRPAAISSDISNGSLESPGRESGSGDDPTAHMEALDAVVRSCLSVDRIIRKLYADREVSTEVGHGLLMESIHRANTFHPKFDAARLLQEHLPPDEAAAVLHADLIETYSVVLLTRPFFFAFLIKVQSDGKGPEEVASTDITSLGRLSESCVAASTRIVALVYMAYRSNRQTAQNSFLLCGSRPMFGNNI